MVFQNLTASRKRAAPAGDHESAPKKRKPASSKPAVPGAVQQDDEGNEYWELSGNGKDERRVQLSQFKGNVLVNIREYYEKDNKVLPGKKGISLSIDQFKAVIEALPEIEASLQAKNIELPRPDYGDKAAESEPEPEQQEDSKAAIKEDEEPEEEAASKTSKESRLDKFKHKANHEATSEEDD